MVNFWRFLYHLIVLSITIPVYVGIYWWIRDDWEKLFRYSRFNNDFVLEQLVKVQRINRKRKAAKVMRLLKRNVGFPNVLVSLIGQYIV